MRLEGNLVLLVVRHVSILMRNRTGDQISVRTRKGTSELGRTSGRVGTGNQEAKLQVILHDQPRASSRINDNYCVTKLQTRLLAGSTTSTETLDIYSHVNFPVVSHVLSATGPPQRKGLSPGLTDVKLKDGQLKYVKGVSSVIHLFCVKPVTNVKHAAQNLPVVARLQNFWQTWLDLGASPKVVQILKEGYTLPFQIWPNLTRSPTVISCYANPHRNSYLLEALHQLIDKNEVELVQTQTSLGSFNQLF